MPTTIATRGTGIQDLIASIQSTRVSSFHLAYPAEIEERDELRKPPRPSCRSSSTATASPPSSTPEHQALDWIGFYADERLHEALGNLPPAEYEMINYRTDNKAMVAAT